MLLVLSVAPPPVAGLSKGEKTEIADRPEGHRTRITVSLAHDRREVCY